MFGYIVPLKQELRMRELAQYNAYYCGLCTSIGARFGQAARPQILMLRLRGISCAMIGKMKRKYLHLQEKAY